MTRNGFLPVVCIALALLLGGCGSDLEVGLGSPSAPSQAISQPEAVATASSQPQAMDMPQHWLVNQTEDMTFVIDGEACAPGTSMDLAGPLEKFIYKNPEYEREDTLYDISTFLKGRTEVVVASDAETGYTLAVSAEGRAEAATESL